MLTLKKLLKTKHGSISLLRSKHAQTPLIYEVRYNISTKKAYQFLRNKVTRDFFSSKRLYFNVCLYIHFC